MTAVEGGSWWAQLVREEGGSRTSSTWLQWQQTRHSSQLRAPPCYNQAGRQAGPRPRPTLSSSLCRLPRASASISSSSSRSTSAVRQRKFSLAMAAQDRQQKKKTCE